MQLERSFIESGMCNGINPFPCQTCSTSRVWLVTSSPLDSSLSTVSKQAVALAGSLLAKMPSTCPFLLPSMMPYPSLF